MKQNETNSGPFEWSPKREQAAFLLAEDRLTAEEIADEVGVGRVTLWRWEQHADFAARVDTNVRDLCAAVRRHGVGRVENRVRRLDRDWRKLQLILDERALADDVQDVPGGKTGLIVHQIKSVGRDQNFRIVDVYEVDTGLLAEIRAHEQQAAKELGQWAERAESRQYDMSQFDDEELARLAAGEPIDRVLASASRRRTRAATAGTAAADEPAVAAGLLPAS